MPIITLVHDKTKEQLIRELNAAIREMEALFQKQNANRSVLENDLILMAENELLPAVKQALNEKPTYAQLCHLIDMVKYSKHAIESPFDADNYERYTVLMKKMRGEFLTSNLKQGFKKTALVSICIIGTVAAIAALAVITTIATLPPAAVIALACIAVVGFFMAVVPIEEADHYANDRHNLGYRPTPFAEGCKIIKDEFKRKKDDLYKPGVLIAQGFYNKLLSVPKSKVEEVVAAPSAKFKQD